MSDLLPFVKCSSPVIVRDHLGLQRQVPCGHCIPCRNKRQADLRTALRLEEHRAKYCYFFTLTYDDQNLPLYEVSFDNGQLSSFPLNERIIQRSVDKFGEIGVARTFDSLPKYITAPWSTVGLEDFNHERRRVERDAFRKYLIEDTNTNYIHFINNYVSWQRANVSSDYKCSYENEYIETLQDEYNRTRTFRAALLPYDDMQLYIKRLRDLIKRNYGEEVRHYTIGEYGSRSLRPHWHMLLFFNSDTLYRELSTNFEIISGLPEGKNTIPVLFRTLWQYGIATAYATNKSAYSYLSTYVSKPADFPKFIDILSPQKAYHSNDFGSVLQQEDIAKVLDTQDFESFLKRYYINFNGDERAFSLWRSIYSKVFVRLPYSDWFSPEVLFRLYKSYDTLRSVFRTDNVADISRYIVAIRKGLYPEDFRVMPFIRDTNIVWQTALHNDDIYAPYERLLYASKRFCSIKRNNGVTYLKLFEITRDFYAYLQLNVLGQHYQECEDNPQYASMYYDILNGSVSYFSDEIFRKWQTLEISKYYKTQKHRKEVEMMQAQTSHI